MLKRQTYQNHPNIVWTHTIEDSRIASVKAHQHYDQVLILTYLAHGTGRLLVEGIDHYVASGDLLILNPNEFHLCHFDECDNHERISLYINPNLASTVSANPETLFEAYYGRKPGNQNIIPRDLVRSLGIDALLREIAVPPAADASEEDYNLHLSCLVIELLLRLKKAIVITPAYTQKAVRNDLILKVLEYVNEHLREELSVSTVADAFFLDKSYLCRVFRKFNGITLGQYITQKRIDYAISLLNRGVRCTDACFESGFGNYSSFFKAFKSFIGVDPNHYRAPDAQVNNR